jgi:hypothetical protein
MSMASATGGLTTALNLGHSSIQITLDRYSHRMPGNEQEVARIFDRYLRTREDLA